MNRYSTRTLISVDDQVLPATTRLVIVFFVYKNVHNSMYSNTMINRRVAIYSWLASALGASRLDKTKTVRSVANFIFFLTTTPAPSMIPFISSMLAVCVLYLIQLN